MRRLLSFPTAAKVLLSLLVAAALFQLVVLAGFIPVEMVWGGRLKNAEERTVGALVSLSILLAMIAIALARAGRFGTRWSSLARWGLWAMTVVFALNTVGNVFALDAREAWIFAPITAVTALLCARVAWGERTGR
ncbi:MAG: hypothetical protein KF797_00395 [Flavobacteriales bacterium]|nr:hypothetical protein [Flavobacteriales bacterium]